MSLIRGEESSNRHKITFTLRDLIILWASFDQLPGLCVLLTVEYLGRELFWVYFYFFLIFNGTATVMSPACISLISALFTQ